MLMPLWGFSPNHKIFIIFFSVNIPTTFSDTRTEEFLDDKALLILSNNVILPSQYLIVPEIRSSHVEYKNFLVEIDEDGIWGRVGSEELFGALLQNCIES